MIDKKIHLLITRFNLPFPLMQNKSEKEYHQWLLERIYLFENFTLQSYLNLDIKPDFWIILVDPTRFPEKLFQKLSKLIIEPNIIILPFKKNITTSISTFIASYFVNNIPNEIWSTRLDSDDLLSKDFFNNLKNIKMPSNKSKMLITYPGGSHFEVSSKKIYFVSYFQNPFITLCERNKNIKDFNFVYIKPHTELHNFVKNINFINSNTPMWSRVIHKNNLANQSLIKQNLIEINYNDSLKLFGINSQNEKEKSIQIETNKKSLKKNTQENNFFFQPIMNYKDFIKFFQIYSKSKYYVEIGVREGETLMLAQNFAIGIDPNFKIEKPIYSFTKLFKLSSDDFFKTYDLFKELNNNYFDLAFVDGMHLFEFALRDFINLEKYSHSKSFIIFDDVKPRNQKESQRKQTGGAWTGDVWKIYLCLKKYRPDLKLVLVDTKPTGTLVVTNLNKNNDILIKNYNSILNEFLNNFDDFPTNNYFKEFITPDKIQNHLLNNKFKYLINNKITTIISKFKKNKLTNFLYKNSIFKKKENYVWLASFPRSGNTWLRFLISDIILQKEGFKTNTILPININSIIPDEHYPVIKKDNYQSKQFFQIIKTHKLFNNKMNKIIFLYRNPLDALISYFYFEKKENPNFNEDINIFILKTYPNWNEHSKSFLDKKEEKILFVSYESLINNTENTLQKIIKYLKIKDVSDEIISKAIKNHTFEKHQNIEKKTDTKNKILFFRKGQINQNDKDLSPKIKEEIFHATQNIYQSLCFLEKGIQLKLTTKYDLIQFYNKYSDFVRLREKIIGRSEKDYINCNLKLVQDLAMVDFIKKHIPKGSKLLEIGGGESRVLEYFSKDYECWNLDKLEGHGNGPKTIRSKPKYKIIKDYIGNFNKSLPNNYFDFVFSISVFEHINEPEEKLKYIMDDIERILKKDGQSAHCIDCRFVPGKNPSINNRKMLQYLLKINDIKENYIFENHNNPHVFHMSEQAYDKYWKKLCNNVPASKSGLPFNIFINFKK